MMCTSNRVRMRNKLFSCAALDHDKSKQKTSLSFTAIKTYISRRGKGQKITYDSNFLRSVLRIRIRDPMLF